MTPTESAPTPRPDEAGDRSAARPLSAADAARLAAVFGEVMPSTTSDERGPDSGAGQSNSDSDEWLRAQVPPHHG